MNDKITLVTPPDDILEDGLRILLVGLNPTQSHIISEALKKSDHPNIIVYMANSLDIEWMVDKKHKSSIIVFNADLEDQTLVGYMAAQRNSYYFGVLRTLSNLNKNAIYSIEQFVDLMEKYV